MPLAQKKSLKPILFTAVALMVLTVIHHAYGAVIYDEPFRMHVTFFALPVIALLIILYHVYGKNPVSRSGTVALWIFIFVALIIPVGLIGFFEGGYNHLVKNILFFAGAAPAILNQLFPPPTYEMPNDFWFEATGISQFIVAIPGVYYLLKFRNIRRS